MIISFSGIVFVMSGYTFSRALFMRTGRSSPIPWHLSCDTPLQSEHVCFFKYAAVNVFLIRFVKTFEPKSCINSSCVVSVIFVFHLFCRRMSDMRLSMNSEWRFIIDVWLFVAMCVVDSFFGSTGWSNIRCWNYGYGFCYDFDFWFDFCCGHVHRSSYCDCDCDCDPDSW